MIKKYSAIRWILLSELLDLDAMSSEFHFPEIADEAPQLVEELQLLCKKFRDLWGTNDDLNVPKFLRDNQQQIARFAHPVKVDDAIKLLEAELVCIQISQLRKSNQEIHLRSWLSQYPQHRERLESEFLATRLDQQSNCIQCGNSITEDSNSKGLQICGRCGHSIFETDEFVDIAEETRSYLGEEKPPKWISNRYEVVEKLGQGAFGVVFRCVDHDLKREVAIKVPKKKLGLRKQELFIREARAASRLSHSNIVTVHDVNRDEDLIYIVNDLIEGTTLRRWFGSRDVTKNEAVGLARILCEAMHHAHSQGIVHRDLKPGNIMMDRDDRPHILDFGLSQSLDRTLETIAKKGMVVGTPAFMAPEQALGKTDKIGPRTDVYALGVILFQLLTGRLPFTGAKSSLLEEIVETSAPAPSSFDSSIPKSLDAIVLKAMAKKQDDRYSSGAEMALDLKRFEEGKIVAAHGQVERRVVKSFIKRRSLLGAATLFGICTVGLGIWSYQKRLEQFPTWRVLVETEPPAADLTWERMIEDLGEFEAPVNSIGGKHVRLAPGFYRVKIQTPDGSLNVFRTIPKKDELANQKFLDYESVFVFKHLCWDKIAGSIHLKRISYQPVAEIKNGMELVVGGEMQLLANQMPYRSEDQQFMIKNMLMDSREVTYRDLKRILADKSNVDEKYEKQVVKFVSSFPQNLDMPVVNMPFPVALEYAELAGKEIPSAWQMVYAATNRFEEKDTIFPWGDDTNLLQADWPTGPIDERRFDKNNAGVFGLYSGPAEWTNTCGMPTRGIAFPFNSADLRGVFGGPLSDNANIENRKNKITKFSFERTDLTTKFSNVGFRCVRSLE